MNRRNFFARLLPVLLLALMACGTGWAQASGSLVGTVMDNQGAAVPGATVVYTNAGTNETRTATSDPSGNYQFLQLQPGMYKVTVSAPGFKQFVRSNIEVTLNNATRIDTPMEVGAVSETVEVSTESPLVSTQSSSLNYEVGTKQIDNLPLNGRNVLNLVSLVPGVVPQGNTSGNASTLNVNGWGNYQIGGGAANQSQTFIDGAPINVSYTNSTALVPTQDVVQEFQVSTNNVSPEYGRFAGGVILMGTKAGTNDFHGTLYEYYRDAALNANLFFNKRTGLSRPVYTQHQFGAAVGGPIIKNHTFAFLSWEEFSLRQASPTVTTVPTAQMLNGDFSQISGQLYDPINKDSQGNRLPFGGNQIPRDRLNSSALAIAKVLFPAPTNPNAIVNNFNANVPRATVYNQYTVRIDHQLNSKNQLFARFTNWHKNASGSSSLQNQIGNQAAFATTQAVFGDSFTLTSNLVGQARASYLRFYDSSFPFLCCSYDEGSQLGNWGSYQSQIRWAQPPQPNITGFNNFSTGATILDTDNTYALSGNLTWTVGRHSIQFGGESRRIEWAYAQSNSPGGTFTFDNGYTASKLGGTGGYSFASYMLGFPTAGSAQEPNLSLGTLYYSGLFVADSFRASKSLTINVGLRWEQPGSFHERNNSLTTMDMDLAQPALSAAAGRTITGGLVLVDSPQRSSRTWQDQHWALFSPRIGFAYSPGSDWVVRGGFGISYLPNTVAFSLGPYNNPPNSAITTMTASLNGGADPYLGTTLSNPFPDGIAQGAGHSQAGIDALLGTGIQSPLAKTSYPYSQQWNLGLQHQFGQGLVVDAGYVGTHGVSLPLYSINLDQLPNQYNSMGADLFTQVPNPFYGIIPASAGILGQPTVGKGYLLKPHPQYLYMTQDAPSIADSSYQALQLRVEERFRSAGVLLVSYTHAHLEGTADPLTGWLEGSRFGVGGASGVQDNNNIKNEYSKSSFDIPDRAVISYTLGLPFGRGHRLLHNANGLVDRLVDDWTLNGIFTFQSGLPIAFQDSSANTLETYFAAGNAGPGLPAGVTRPNRVAGCDPVIGGSPKSKLGKYFNTACYTVPGPYEYGNEPRVDPTLRAQGQNNFDLSVAKKVDFERGIGFEFRAEAYNLFNRTQFAPPNAQADTPQYGTVTSQTNQPRIMQLSGRINF
ncbi:MAG TPA: carboxypeptidase regulatory-like domain-containing protein [Granulicella sp.]